MAWSDRAAWTRAPGRPDESDELAARFAAVVASTIVEAAPVAEQVAPARCRDCGRPIRAAASVARGLGEGCLRKARRRAVELGDAYSDDQVEAAVEAVEDGAVVPDADAGVWLVVASKGEVVYTTDGAVFDCPAGKAGRACVLTRRQRCAGGRLSAAVARRPTPEPPRPAANGVRRELVPHRGVSPHDRDQPQGINP